MAKRRVVSRSGSDQFLGLAWNAMIDLCAMEPTNRLSPIQRTAAFAFWYMSEVNNGGHFQYFVNRHADPHLEVVDALRVIGAQHSARVLLEALEQLGPDRPPQRLTDVAHYLRVERELDLSRFDTMWGAEGDREINQRLEDYLRHHEDEFVEWVD
jgi:hypothetical protein